MIAVADIQNGYSTAQAAQLLGVDGHEVTRLYRAGVILGHKIAGGALILDAQSVQTYRNVSCGSGRPWDAQTAWAALLLLDGQDIDWLPYHRRRRLLQKLNSVSASELVWLARKRAAVTRYRISPSFSDDLRGKLCLTGMSASSVTDLGLVAASGAIDGYVTDPAGVVRDFYLMPDAAGTCFLRTPSDVPAGLLLEGEMPKTVVAADLAFSLDVRERRCGLDYLERVLHANR